MRALSSTRIGQNRLKYVLRSPILCTKQLYLCKLLYKRLNTRHQVKLFLSEALIFIVIIIVTYRILCWRYLIWFYIRGRYNLQHLFIRIFYLHIQSYKQRQKAGITPLFVPDGMCGMSGMCDVTRYQGDTKGLLFSSIYVNIVLFSTQRVFCFQTFM